MRLVPTLKAGRFALSVNIVTRYRLLMNNPPHLKAELLPVLNLLSRDEVCLIRREAGANRDRTRAQVRCVLAPIYLNIQTFGRVIAMMVVMISILLEVLHDDNVTLTPG